MKSGRGEEKEAGLGEYHRLLLYILFLFDSLEAKKSRSSVSDYIPVFSLLSLPKSLSVFPSYPCLNPYLSFPPILAYSPVYLPLLSMYTSLSIFLSCPCLHPCLSFPPVHAYIPVCFPPIHASIPIRFPPLPIYISLQSMPISLSIFPPILSLPAPAIPLLSIPPAPVLSPLPSSLHSATGGN